ncbi:coiled-coil domain-containing protein 194 isoform X2 [Hemicordylus capensis]|uniref:coiled-coil domain-containing protein 194 isoform X2 n=1 Tax=Hemicordylus capensis TaxID=884348 RepID=UPI002303ECC4|nr:coiled-coil domain-containing protein 194 isoform X2 [Hemicordylus capensis]
MWALQAEGTEIGSRNGILQAEMAQWQEEVAGLQQRLEAAQGEQEAAKAEKQHCQAQQGALQESVQSYLAEIASLRRQLGARSSTRRRCHPFRKG